MVDEVSLLCIDHGGEMGSNLVVAVGTLFLAYWLCEYTLGRLFLHMEHPSDMGARDELVVLMCK